MITFSEYLHSLNESKTQEEFEELVEGYHERLQALEEEGQDIHVSAPNFPSVPLSRSCLKPPKSGKA